jgi:hypothetical protein
MKREKVEKLKIIEKNMEKKGNKGKQEGGRRERQ